MPAPIHHFTVDLDIPAHEMERLYRGSARVVHARTHDGRRIQFPAHLLRRFVTRNGVQGTFEVSVDGKHRLVDIVSRRSEA